MLLVSHLTSELVRNPSAARHRKDFFLSGVNRRANSFARLVGCTVTSRRTTDNACIELFASHAETLVEARLTINVYVC